MVVIDLVVFLRLVFVHFFMQCRVVVPGVVADLLTTIIWCWSIEIHVLDGVGRLVVIDSTCFRTGDTRIVMCKCCRW